MKKSPLHYVRCVPHFSLFVTEKNHLKCVLVIVLLTAFSFRIQATETIPAFSVSGRVVDEAGEPVPGANILEKGTTNGTTTNSNGSYQLNVTDENVTLIFSFIGYATQEVAVNSQATINITLVPDTQSLNEVIVVGYGSQLKKEITGSVQTVT